MKAENGFEDRSCRWQGMIVGGIASRDPQTWIPILMIRSSAMMGINCGVDALTRSKEASEGRKRNREMHPKAVSGLKPRSRSSGA